jgi:hypothetical protein
MSRSRSVFVGLLIIILLPGTFACIAVSTSAASADGAPPPSQAPLQASSPPAQASSSPAVEPNVVPSMPQAAPGPAITSRAASGATAWFTTQNGQTVGDVPPRTSDIPRLVLHRNGALTAPDERTLIVEVTGIEVPPPGVTVTLRVETQHGDPDLRDGSDSRIPVWRESQWIANTSGSTQMGVTAVFVLAFDVTVTVGSETIPTPTDYFRYDVTVINAGFATHTLSADHAFLMESQWVAPLPQVQEVSDGAAPDELIVYYCDMFPFQGNAYDVTTRLPRAAVSAYVQTELVPRMIEAFRVQTDEWGFPWYDAWISCRPGKGEDTERLSVALSDGQTWFHGSAPSSGHSGISINVAGGEHARYDTLTDGIMSTFYHELFHSHQRNIHLEGGGNGDMDGEQDAWQLFSEGTAAMVPSVGQPGVQFASAARSYPFDANGFVGGGGSAEGLNRSYAEIYPYYAAVYWRFLYEQCGGMKGGTENPAAGMAVIRRALTALYSGDVVDISASTDLVRAMPGIMDRALAGSACPFQTYAESLTAFARAIYTLRLEDGRCTTPGTPDGCGFYDPNNQYLYPPVSTITYAGVDQQLAGEIKSSFGIDFVDVVLDPAAAGHPLTLEFYGAPGAGATFNVQLWQLVESGPGARPRRLPGQTVPEVLTATNVDGHLSTVIPAIDTTATNRLGLIITRVDPRESSDPIGAYTIALRAEVGQ